MYSIGILLYGLLLGANILTDNISIYYSITLVPRLQEEVAKKSKINGKIDLNLPWFCAIIEKQNGSNGERK